MVLTYIFTMISLEKKEICPNELNELDKIRQSGWDRLSEKTIKDNKSISTSQVPLVLVYCDKQDKQSKHMTWLERTFLYLCTRSCIVWKIVLY